MADRMVTQALTAGTAALLVAKKALMEAGCSPAVIAVVDGGLEELDDARKKMMPKRQEWNLDREFEAIEMEQAYAQGMAE